MIVKAPITGDEVLIYNKNRSIMQTFPATEELRVVIGPKLKKYFHAHINKSNQLELDREAAEQIW